MVTRSDSAEVDSSAVTPTGLILPFADAPSIVQAHQKDNQTEAVLSFKLEKFLKILKGQRFTNAHGEEIFAVVKLLYLGITTIAGNRTLGEEYVDLIYVNRTGRGLVKLYRKLLFVLSYAIGPFVLSKIIKRWNRSSTDDERIDERFSYKKILDMVLNLHLVIFYFKGRYYDAFKRVLGLRYAIGHKVSANESKFRKSYSDTYKFLGYILLLQVASKRIPVIIRYIKKTLTPISQERNNSEVYHKKDNEKSPYSITGIPDIGQLSHIDLSDESQLAFVPAVSRTCILCLSAMLDPSCAPCGHLFCWSCIIDWCKERAECPLCRQKTLPQQVLSIR